MAPDNGGMTSPAALPRASWADTLKRTVHEFRDDKLQHWAAAHDLVAEFVPPATGSRWVKGVRTFADVAEPKPYIDEVLDDEFPLSLFYVSLQ